MNPQRNVSSPCLRAEAAGLPPPSALPPPSIKPHEAINVETD
jgi:hypothetical protein